MTLNVLGDPSQLKPVSFWPSTVLLSVWIICMKRGQTHTSKIHHMGKPNTKFLMPRGLRQYLYVDLVVCRSVYRPVEPEPDHKYPSVYWEPEWHTEQEYVPQCLWLHLNFGKLYSSHTTHSLPYTVACPAVAPATLHLSKTRDAALLPAEAATRPVDEIHTRLWVDCEVKEQTHHLSVSQNTGLGRTWEGKTTRPRRWSTGFVCVYGENNQERVRTTQRDESKVRVTGLMSSCSPAANSSMVMRGKRMSVRAFPRTLRLFSGVGCSCCLWASASAQRTAAPNKRTSLTPRVSLSNTATKVSEGGRYKKPHSVRPWLWNTTRQ